MARKISSRLIITGSMIAETSLHVGGYGDSPDTDLPLAQNGKGNWYVPGTSIAGVMRSWFEQNLGTDLTDSLFAWKARKSDAGKPEKDLEEKKHASFILIEDAVIEDFENVLMEVRDGVGIDRCYGVAADQAKFDRAILPRGTTLDLVMTVEIHEESDANLTRAAIRQLLEALSKSRMRFGAAKTRGLGRVKLKNIRIKEDELYGFEAIMRLLKNENNAKPFATWLAEFELRLTSDDKLKFKQLKKDQPRLSIEVVWKPRLPVMVKTGYDGIGVDMLPLTSRVEKDKVALVLPGSSIKGVMRSHAERIVRTVLDFPSMCDKQQVNFHDQIKEVPLIDELFGAKAERNRQDHRGLGALAADDCYAKETMDSESWQKIETADSDEGKPYFKRHLWRYLRQVDEQSDTLTEDAYREPTQKFSIEHHVAIDRWTGGASEGALYSVLAPNAVDWEPMRLTLDFTRIPENSRLPALMLLCLTLRDVAENRLPFGFATNRGMGEIAVQKIAVEGQDLSDQLKELTKFESNGKFVELSPALKDKLRQEWDVWSKTPRQI